MKKIKPVKAWAMVHSHDFDGVTPIDDGGILVRRIGESRAELRAACNPWNRVVRVLITPIDYLEGFIEAYERAKADPRHAAIDEMTAEAQRLGMYDEDRCTQCGKRYPGATCPACQQQNIRELNGY